MSPAAELARDLLVAGTVGGALVVAFLCAAILAFGRARDRGTLVEPSIARGVALQLGLWTIPTVVVLVLFVIGVRGYVRATIAPADALEIAIDRDGVRWRFDYGGGLVTEDVLRLPTERAVHFVLRGAPQATRLAAPSLRLRLEAWPGHDDDAWLVVDAPGSAPFATGIGAPPPPPSMALSSLDFERWQKDADGASLPPAEYGKKLYARSQCQTCHSLDGTIITGPSFKGIFGTKAPLADGTEVLVDAKYIAESVLDPGAKLVRGFQPLMPSFRGQLDDKQIAALVAFIEAQKP